MWARSAQSSTGAPTARSRSATAGPTPSSLRNKLPRQTAAALRAAPPRSGGSGSRRRCTGRVPDRLLAAVRELVVGEVERAADDPDEVLLDRLLVLRRRGHDLRVEDRPIVVDPGSGASRCRAAPRCSRGPSRRGGRIPRPGSSVRSYAAMMRSASSRRVHDLDRAHDDRAKRVRDDPAEAGLLGASFAAIPTARRSSRRSARAGRRGRHRRPRASSGEHWSARRATP